MSELPPSDSAPVDVPPRREPAFNMPRVVFVCCLVLLGIHLVRSFLSSETDDALVVGLAFVPARLAIALGVAQQQLQASVQTVPAETLGALVGAGGSYWWTLLTYAFLHGSWAHVGFNCVWLVAFGAPVARRFGAARFLALMVVCAILGALVQFAVGPASFVPVIGASAAVSGAMGAAARFVFRPTGEPMRLFDRARINDAFRQPALSMRQTLSTGSALFFIAVWFATNLLFGLFPALSGVGDGPIAWQAHIGGFLAGLMLFPFFDPRPPSTGLEADENVALPPPATEPT